jgi:hypothetical protein
MAALSDHIVENQISVFALKLWLLTVKVKKACCFIQPTFLLLPLM